MNNPIQTAMIDHNQTFLALDIGTSKIVALLANTQNNQLNILAIAKTPTQGLKKGMVIDVQKTIHSIHLALQEIAINSPHKAKKVYVGVSGSHIQSMVSHGISAIKHLEVSKEDIQSALASAQAVRLSEDQQLVHTFIQGFSIDNQEEIQDPIGMSGVRLELKVELLASGTTATQNVLKCVKRCGLEMQEVVINPFAASLATLGESEKELGVALVDIGAGTCDIAIYYKGVMRHIEVIPIAGDHITNDISIAMRIPAVEAEDIKIKYGVARQRNVNSSEFIQVNDVGGFNKKVSRQLLATVIESRLAEIFSMVAQVVQQSGYAHLIASGYAFTGGCVHTSGFLDLASDVLKNNCRMAAPNHQGSLRDMLNHPSYSAGMGILQHAYQLQQNSDEHLHKSNPAIKAAKKAWRWLVGTF